MREKILKNKSNAGFAILILTLILIGIVVPELSRNIRKVGKEQSIPTWNELHSLELMAIMENEMAKDNPDSSVTSTEDLPDYTKMFPDLYTVFSIPKEMDKDKKIAYLTFDDGPSANTFEVLDILEEMDIKATFFIVGSAITDEGEDCLKRMVNEGHTIGIHTYSHRCNEIYCSVERFLDDFNTVYQQIYDITDERVNIYRFPWGSNNGYSKGIKDALIDEMERRGFTCYDWNVSADDSIGKPTPYSILHSIQKNLKRENYPIILMHDSKINDLTVQMLPEIIKMISDKGYVFDTLDNRDPYQFPW
jgi:peptidoglycan/xylan/chitin deacetylase (PgdA/CDA1 family)